MTWTDGPFFCTYSMGATILGQVTKTGRKWMALDLTAEDRSKQNLGSYDSPEDAKAIVEAKFAGQTDRVM